MAGSLVSMLRRPVVAALLTAILLHGLWLLLIANGGGDLAAQDAWAEFARAHPGIAYDLSWYGGMHPASYSVLSPYVMAFLGVRTTLLLAGVVSSGLLALVLVRSKVVKDPLGPSIYGAFALAGNAVSGRATFGLGIMFALAAAVVAFTPADDVALDTRGRRRRGATAAILSVLATASSPVAGLFLGLLAAALWLRGRRRIGYALGIPPVVVVGMTALLFPFSGDQPMALRSLVMPLLLAVCCWRLTPASWRVVRIGSMLYLAGVIVVFLVPSQIGSNVNRLALIFGGVVLVSIAAETWRYGGRTTRSVLAAAVLVATGWQVATATADVVNTRSAATWTSAVGPLVTELRYRHADLARVEVVPSRSHREASALAPYLNLARGWNRQADAGRNTLFYAPGLLTESSYRTWLDRWAVHYVFLPDGEPDPAALGEATLVAHGLPYLHLVWTGSGGRLFQVQAPAPLVTAPAKVDEFAASLLVLTVPRAGSFELRIPSSPWLSVIDDEGRVLSTPADGCFTTVLDPASPAGGKEEWAVLEAPHAGTYRISTPYNLHRGTACPKAQPQP
ncbi:MAG: rane protein [Marmoricola sp.]|nr:rane protein [Marmoricola sp.]